MAATPCVMVAGSDPEVRRAIADALRDDGCAVMVANDGARVVTYAEDALVFDIPRPRVHVLVTDADLTDLAGVKVLARLEGMGWSLPTVVLANRLDEETQRIARDLDAPVVLGRPDLPRVLESVRGALAEAAA